MGSQGLSAHQTHSSTCCQTTNTPSPTNPAPVPTDANPIPTNPATAPNPSLASPVPAVNPRTRYTQPLPPSPPIDREAESLFSKGRERPVLHISATALLPLRNALIRILGIIANNMILEPEGQALTNAVSALMLLPSLVYDANQNHTLNPSRLATIYNRIANTADPIQEVLSLYAVHAATKERTAVKALEAIQTGLATTRRKSAPSQQRSEQKTLLKACELTVNGRPGKAVQLIEQIGSNGPMSNESARSPANIAKIQALHPQARPQDSLPLNIQHRTRQLQINQEQLAIGFENLPDGSAAALSGWTYDLLKQLTFRHDETQLAILAVFNLILDGRGGSPTLWTISRLCLIAKPDGGLRPIAIGDVWIRALCRIVNSIIAPEVGPALAPFQYGVGVKGGAEIVSHLCQGAQHYMEARDDELIPWDAHFDDPNDPLCISALDVANAFNTLYRSAIHAGVLEYCPNIISLYRWSYGPTAILCLSDGLPICTSESGIRQGDPLGPLLYCVGVHSTLQDVKIKEPKATIVAFIDDDNIIGLRSKLLNTLSIFQTKLAAIGQICNLPKCILAP